MGGLLLDDDGDRYRRAQEALAMARVGDELRRLREKKGLTLRSLAKQVGVSAPFLSDVEHGRRRLTRLDDVARVLGIKPVQLAAVAGVCIHCMGSGYAPEKSK